MKIGSPRHFGWLRGIVAAVLILNLVDGTMTLYWYFSGRASEANPLMAVLISRHPGLFMIAKTLLVAFGILLLWRYRRNTLAVMGIFLVFLVYYGILLFHLSAASYRFLP